MHFTNRSIRRSSLFYALALLLALLTVACGGAAASTPTPTSTPTPMPLASQPFLDLGPAATVRDLVDRLPADERDCVRDHIPADSEAWEQPAFRKGDIEPLDLQDSIECFSSQSLTGLLTASIAHQAGGLSTPTLVCIEGTFAGVDLKRLIAEGEQQEDSPEQVQRLFGSIVALLLCLSEEEAARIDLGEATGGEGPAMNLQDLRCILQRVDVSVLMDFFMVAEDQSATPSPDDFERLSQLLQAFEACGVEMTGIPGGMPPSPTP